VLDSPSLTQWIQIYESVLNQLDEGVHIVDASTITVVYNHKMSEMESMNREDVVGCPLLDVFRFAGDEHSTLIQAIHQGTHTRNRKQTYFNHNGQSITTVNNTVPIIIDSQIVGAVEIARDVTRVERLLQARKQSANGTHYTFDQIVGKSAAMLAVLDNARRAARTNSSVLIVGETGSGKELVAQSIHQESPRSGGPFVSLNCAALPDSLIEGLLFGTVRGAFTGAVDRPGLLEQANGGTLLLDELNALATHLQAKLLRVLQEKSVRRLGATFDSALDVRIIATVNEDPIDAVAGHRLRKDLYYRLSVVSLFLPPLRERTQDIPLLAAVFVRKYNELFQLQVAGLQPQLLQQFLAYAWPGNVRELEHTIEGAMNLVQHETQIGAQLIPLPIRRRMFGAGDTGSQEGLEPTQSEGHSIGPDVSWTPLGTSQSMNDLSGGATPTPDPVVGGLHHALQQFERAYLASALNQHHNVSAAARALGISRQSLQYRLKRLHLKE